MGLVARPAAGRPPKLTHSQEKVIGRWLADKPTEHGFPTDLWTGPRVALMIRQEFGVELNPKYMTVWLRRRGFTPQKPHRVPRERDPEAIAAWLESDWPRIKKRRDGREPKSP
jgi:transposase